jgi:hypothetical protein
MSDLENCERYADSLYGELEAEKHAHRKDNEYLLTENQRLREALDAADWLITNLRILRAHGVVRGLDEANAAYESAREALAGDAE